MRNTHLAPIGLVAMLALGSLAPPAIEAQQPAAGRWLTAWGTSQAALGMRPVTNATVRMIARVSIPGDAVRIRLDNTFGTTPLAVGKAYVGLRARAATLVAASNQPVTFNHAATVTVPPGGSVVSDPVAVKVLGGQDVAVSLYIPETSVRPSQHGGALVTSYLTADGAGDVASVETREPFTVTTTSMFWLKAIDVQSSTATGAIVALGDSITDGTCSTLDAHDRWEDWLSVRLALDDAQHGGRNQVKAVVNEGIGGATLLREHLQPPPDSPASVERLDRDVLSHQGVSHLIVFMGTNDIRRGASAQHVIDGMQDVLRRAKARGLKVIGVTIIPRHVVDRGAESPRGAGWSAENTRTRNEVNQWIRTKASFDGVIDFDKAVQDPQHPDLLFPPFNCGDGTHPTPRGYFEMAKSVRLDLFR